MNATALVYTAVAASANIIGAAAVVSHSRWSVRALDNMVALSAGFMVSVALLDLAPDAILTHGANAALVILIGYLLVHLTQHTLAPHFHFGEEVHHVTKIVSFSALAGLMLHTFVDGVAIASGFGVSQALGLLVFLAILLHKLPEGLAISSLFLAAGESRAAALGASAALAGSSLLGALLTDCLSASSSGAPCTTWLDASSAASPRPVPLCESTVGGLFPQNSIGDRDNPPPTRRPPSTDHA